ncbi:MAG TPA: hypothetical protein VLE47_00085 [Candidatus Saccharimonadales bacterium]|nr:hypothetical protein [Candidatus Saccharimonadales bacterium]
MEPQPAQPTPKQNLLDKNVPNPLAKNPNFFTHKVFAAIGLILIGAIIAIAGIWWYVQSQDKSSGVEDTTTTTKVSTTSAKTATISATKDETAGWKTYTSINKVYTFKYPVDFTLSTDNTGILDNSSKSYIFSVDSVETTLSVEDWIKANICTSAELCSERVAGVLSNSLQFDDYAHYQSFETVVKHENKLYEISMTSRNADTAVTQGIKSIYLNILSTFKFL